MNTPLMKRLLKGAGVLLLTSVAMAAVLIVAGLLWGGPFDHAVLAINGEPFWSTQRHGRHAVHGLAAIGGLAVAGVVMLLVLVVLLVVLLIVLPVAVVLPLLIAALATVLGTAFGLAVLAGAAALVFSPLLLLAGLGWLIWRLVRTGDKPAAAAGAGAGAGAVVP